MPRGHQCGFFEWEDVSQVLKKKAQTAEKRAEPSVFNRPPPAQANSTAGPSNASLAGNRTPATVNHNHKANYRLGRVARSDTPLSEAASAFTAPVYSPASSVFHTPAPRQGIFRGIPRLGDKSWSSDDEDSDVTADRPAKKPPTKSADKSPAKSPATHQTNLNRYLGLSTPTPKRKRSAVDDGGARGNNSSGATRNDAVIIVSDIDSDDAEELVELADSTERLHQYHDAPSSPSTARGSTRSGFGGLPTPQTGNSFVSTFSHLSSTSKRFKNAQGLAAPPTPTPTRKNRNAFPGAAAAPNYNQANDYPTTNHREEEEDDDAPITSTILSLLHSTTSPRSAAPPPPPEIERAIRSTLNTHARQARGFERARDDLSETLRTRDRCIADLRARVDRLENERRMRWEVLRSDLEALSQSQGDGNEGGAANGVGVGVGGGGGGGGDMEEE
jgi:hypothetical protein